MSGAAVGRDYQGEPVCAVRPDGCDVEAGIESPGNRCGRANVIMDTASLFALLENIFEARMAYEELPGMTVGLIAQDKIIYRKGFGYANLTSKKPTTSKTQYCIASISKPVTALAILQLRDKGKLKLRDPLIKYLPWFANLRPYKWSSKVTLLQCLSHTAGIPRDAAFPYWTDYHFPNITQIKEGLLRQKSTLAPGRKMKYSNLGFALLGEVVS